MKAAVEVYEALAEKDKKDTKIGKCRATIRKCFRSFSNHANSFRDWLAVVPDGDYGAVVCGSLQMIFKAAARLGKVRDDLMEALSEMPETIAMVRSYADIYTNSIRMRDGIHQFEVATLMALEHALLWLTETPFCQCPSAHLILKSGLQTLVADTTQQNSLAFYESKVLTEQIWMLRSKLSRNL